MEKNNLAQEVMKAACKGELCNVEKFDGFFGDNEKMHYFLNDECVAFEEVLGQETWTMADGSFVTFAESVDAYYTGADIDLFG